MRIVFIGTVDFSSHCLQQVIAQGGNVVALLTRAPHLVHYNTDYVDLSPLATTHHIPIYHIRNVNTPSTVDLIRSLMPDIIFVFGCSQLIPPEILDLAPYGCIGSHPALLPRNRGRHPLIWALIEELPESGLTFFYLDNGVDSGDILWQRSFPITQEDDANTLYHKILELAKEAIAEFLPQLQSGTAPRTPQDHEQASYWRKRTAKDGEILWKKSARDCYNLIRALTRPYPGAHTFLNGTERVTIWKSRLRQASQHSSENLPGTLVQTTSEGILILCGSGMLELLEWERESGKKNLEPGTILGGMIL